MEQLGLRDACGTCASPSQISLSCFTLEFHSSLERRPRSSMKTEMKWLVQVTWLSQKWKPDVRGCLPQHPGRIIPGEGMSHCPPAALPHSEDFDGTGRR